MSPAAVLFRGSGREPPEALSSSEREEGRRLFRRFLKLNGVSVALLMENMLILYAIRNGVSDPLVAAIASFIHLTMPLMVFGKALVSRIGAARTWGLGWFFRYLSASIMILAPFLPRGTPQPVVSVVILLGALGFAGARSIGIVGNTPLVGEITTPEGRGSFLSGNFVRANSTHLVAMAAVIGVLRITEELWVYQSIIAFGCLLGFYAAAVLARIPESLTPRRSASKSFAEVARTLWEEPRMRRLLFAWAAGLVAFTLVIPFSMITVKNGYRISDYLALVFSLPLLLGGIASSLVNGIVADRVGPRPLLLLYTSGLLAVGLFWAFAPERFNPALVGVVFFVAGYCKFGIIVSLGHYFLSAAKESDRVGSSIFMRVFSGAAAGAAGSFVGGGLLQLLGSLGWEGMGVYRSYFRIVLVALVILVLVIRRLERLEEWSIGSILGLLVSPRDMRALYVLNRLKRQQSSSGAQREVGRLGEIGSTLPEEELRSHLYSPRLSVRVEALRALGRISFGRESEEAILRELSGGQYTTAWIAAEILGEHRVCSAIEELRRGLDSPDPFLQGKCMVALVRLEDHPTYDRIRKLFRDAENPRIVIHGANALALTREPEALALLLDKSLDQRLPSAAVDEILTAAASIVGEGGRFYRFLQRYNADRRSGLVELLPDLSSEVLPADPLATLGEESGAQLRYFRRTLLEAARQGEGRGETSAALVRSFLENLGERPLPRKVAFCLALLLSMKVDESAPGPPVE